MKSLTLPFTKARAAPSGVKPQIEVVARTDPHNLVIKTGGAQRCLRFNQNITGETLRQFCHQQFGWVGLNEMELVVDGHAYSPSDAGSVTLEATPAKAPGTSAVCQTVEFRRPAPAKG